MKLRSRHARRFTEAPPATVICAECGESVQFTKATLLWGNCYHAECADTLLAEDAAAEAALAEQHRDYNESRGV